MKGTVTIDLSDYDFLREQIRRLTEQNAAMNAALQAAPVEERKRMGENLSMLIRTGTYYVDCYLMRDMLLGGEDPFVRPEVTPQDG